MGELATPGPERALCGYHRDIPIKKCEQREQLRRRRGKLQPVNTRLTAGVPSQCHGEVDQNIRHIPREDLP